MEVVVVVLAVGSVGGGGGGGGCGGVGSGSGSVSVWLLALFFSDQNSFLGNLSVFTCNEIDTMVIT